MSKRYRSRSVLEGVSFEAYAGQVVLLMGPNGCGKSTLLQIIAGLLQPDAGRAEVDGSIGYSPQHGGLVDLLLPSEQFVLFGRGCGLSRVRAVAEGRRIAEQPGWDAHSAPVAGVLSGGTRQKLNVALALLGEPQVLLLDEPYQGLDVDSARRFWELLWAWRDAGHCAIGAAHSHDAIAGADVVIELTLSHERGGRRCGAR